MVDLKTLVLFLRCCGRHHLNDWSIGSHPPKIHVLPLLNGLLGVAVGLFAAADLAELITHGVSSFCKLFSCR